MKRATPVAPFAFVAALLVTALVAIAATSVTNDGSTTTTVTTTVTKTVTSSYRGRPASAWARRARSLQSVVAHQRRSARRLRRELRAAAPIREAIGLAAVVYRVPSSTLWRKALCETGGTLNPYSRNRSSNASGLFQFLPSTWRTTPFAGFSIWDPFASALAAGWMHARGRGGEWECR